MGREMTGDKEEGDEVPTKNEQYDQKRSYDEGVLSEGTGRSEKVNGDHIREFCGT